jgi:hypothetical protein
MIHDLVLLNGILTDLEPEAAIQQMPAEIKAHLAQIVEQVGGAWLEQCPPPLILPKQEVGESASSLTAI